jgi:hypothetical protein
MSVTPVWDRPFHHSAGMESDPLPGRLLTDAPITRVRMPPGVREVWLVDRLFFDRPDQLVRPDDINWHSGSGWRIPRTLPLAW